MMTGKNVLVLIIVLAILLKGILPVAPILQNEPSEPMISLQPMTAYAASPATYQGTIRYSKRGWATFCFGGGGMVMAVGWPAIIRIGEVVEQLPALVEEGSSAGLDPYSEAAISDWFELSPNPMAKFAHGSYDALISFTLEEKRDGTFQLQSGHINWSADNSANLGVLRDSFIFSGNEALDTSRNKINLRFDHSTDPPSFILDFEIFSMGMMSGEIGIFNADIPLDAPMFSQIGYSGRGELLDPNNLRLNEVYSDIFDNLVRIDAHLAGPHEIRIVRPEPGTHITFDQSDEGILEFNVEATIEPRSLEPELDNLYWDFPDIVGSTLITDPEEPVGRRVNVRYEGLPFDNSEFGELSILAHLEGFNDPRPVRIKVFFPRDAMNNPDGDVPNWFYYWKQTSAAQGLEGYMRYCDIGHLSDEPALGYYLWFQDPSSIPAWEFYITNLVTGRANNPLYPTRRTEGIDTFAITVLHEYQHLLDYHEWWGPLYDPDRIEEWRATCGDGNEHDFDGDGVPCEVEERLGLDPQNPRTYGNLPDAELSAYEAEIEWMIDSADREDWADPGKQSRGEN